MDQEVRKHVSFPEERHRQMLWPENEYVVPSVPKSDNEVNLGGEFELARNLQEEIKVREMCHVVRIKFLHRALMSFWEALEGR